MFQCDNGPDWPLELLIHFNTSALTYLSTTPGVPPLLVFSSTPAFAGLLLSPLRNYIKASFLATGIRDQLIQTDDFYNKLYLYW